MTYKGAVSACLLMVCVACCTGQFHYDDVMKFESYNYRTYHMGFENKVGSAGEREAYLSAEGNRFYLRQGLNGGTDTVSFESADFKGYYLRYYNDKLDLERRDGARDADNFDTDATFQGSHGGWYEGFMSFESKRQPGRYIRHRSWRLLVEESDSSELFEQDASWRMSKGPFVLESRGQYDCVPPCKLAMGINSEAVMSGTGTQLYVISPGLDAKHGESVSFHHAERPELFLRTFGSTIFFENSSNIIRDPAKFEQDASFTIRWNRFVNDYFSIEEMIGGRYMCRTNYEVQMKQDDGSAYFVDDASFRTLEGPLLLALSSGDKIAVDDDQQGVMNSEGTRFNLLYPGLTLSQGTVSLESYEESGKYLRHYGSMIDLEDPETGRNPEIFKDDASFYVRMNVFGEGTISLESENYVDRYLCHSDNRLVIKQYEDTAEFKSAAAFTKIQASTEIKPKPTPTSPNTTAIIAASCTIGIILLLIVLAFFIDKMLNKRSAARENREGSAGIENPVYETKGTLGDGQPLDDVQTADTPGHDPLYTEVGASQPKYGDRVVIEPLPSVSSLVKNPAPQAPMRESFGAKLRRSLSGTSDEDSIPIRNAIQTKLRRLSNSFSKADKAQNRRADIPTNFDIDFNKPFDFEGDPVKDGGVGFGNPLFGQQPSRVSLTFDELPSPMDFGLDGFEAGKSSSETTPSNEKVASFFEDDEDSVSFPPIKKKSQSYVTDAAPNGTGMSFFDSEPETPSFPSIRRKSSDKKSPTGKRVSFSDTTVSSPEDPTDEPPIYAAVDFSKKKKVTDDTDA